MNTGQASDKSRVKNITHLTIFGILFTLISVGALKVSAYLLKSTQQFLPPSLDKKYSWHYEDLADSIVIDAKGTLKTIIVMDDGRQFLVQESKDRIKEFCDGYIEFEYTPETRAIIASTTSPENYPDEILLKCFNASIEAIQMANQEKQKKISARDKSKWKPNYLGTLFSKI
ncbi:MAG: hypothetical protein CL840_15460 [Crocinitomicaceae bacterium]|nr:hypothetical protein [Crocinitomicaceae bacterium]|tara:strand:+ start:82675 stop:83190 length:516 start_codon:yes stop_codon:yes gene_type:complete